MVRWQGRALARAAARTGRAALGSECRPAAGAKRRHGGRKGRARGGRSGQVREGRTGGPVTGLTGPAPSAARLWRADERPSFSRSMFLRFIISILSCRSCSKEYGEADKWHVRGERCEIPVDQWTTALIRARG
ncbi:unnamed protein product [Closterium sp. Naga37s-1]|nr:unnamed protein product [Closterium sp. Naga37s-1]